MKNLHDNILSKSRKIAIIALMLTAVMAFAACGNKDSNNETTPVNGNVTAKSESTKDATEAVTAAEAE